MDRDDNTKSIITVKDSSGQILETFSLSQRDEAFNYAEQMEALGVEIILEEPSLPETLITSLGADESEKSQLKGEILEEMESHLPNCCDTLH